MAADGGHPERQWSFRSDRCRFTVRLKDGVSPVDGFTPELKQKAWLHYAARHICQHSPASNKDKVLSVWWEHHFSPANGPAIRQRMNREKNQTSRLFELLSRTHVDTATRKKKRRMMHRRSQQQLKQFARLQAVYEVADTSKNSTARRHSIAQHLISTGLQASQQLRARVRAMNPVDLRDVYEDLEQMAFETGEFMISYGQTLSFLHSVLTSHSSFLPRALFFLFAQHVRRSFGPVHQTRTG
ncbi:MAG TPA: hypothetical protein V6C97_20900 [Oculatellaceae cyanobacterium]